MNVTSLHVPKTLLMTADTLGGVWTYALELIKALQNFDIQVHLVTMGRRLSESQWQQVRALPQVRVYESDYKLEWMDDPWEDIAKTGKWLDDLVNKIKPDIIHLNHFAPTNLQWQAPTVVVAHSCVYTWWQSVHHELPPPNWHLYYQWVQKSLQTASKTVSISGVFLQQLQKIYNFHNNSTIIYNGIDVKVKKDIIKQPLVIALGRIWDEAKNMQLLDAIAPQLPWVVQIAGDAFHPVLKKTEPLVQAKHLGVLNRAEVLQKLTEASIFVLPAHYEPFGLAPLEAAQCGCALVLADLPTLREIWGEAAWYFPPNDAVTATRQLNQLIENEPLRTLMQQKARQRAQRYTADQMAKQYYDLYQQLLNKKHKLFKNM